MALTDKLFAIGNAIRSKNGTTELMTLDAMPAAIEAIETGSVTDIEIPTLTGNCDNMFYGDKWNWFIEQRGDKIKTSALNSTIQMFAESTTLESIPFDFDFTYFYWDPPFYIVNYSDRMFLNCHELTEIGDLKDWAPIEISSIFEGCWNLRYLPNITGDSSFVNMNSSYENCQNKMFYDCHSLRSIPQTLLNNLYSLYPSGSGHFFDNTFNGCYVLDEIVGLSPETATLTENAFRRTFKYCHRVKDIIFKTQTDGAPYVAEWTNQTINLYGAKSTTENELDFASNPEYSVGYFREMNEYVEVGSGTLIATKIGYYNSGITEDKEVTDDATYAALKDDPDWYTRRAAYSRYNHNSAVNTINSLPDTSAYVAANGGTNTIVFYGAAGASTDGGAINTLTEEEIAVATAKGWTVSFA